MTLKKRIKKELGFMGKGAKVAGKVVARKGKQWLKAKVAEAKAEAMVIAETQKATKKAEQQAFREEAIHQARIRGKQRAKGRRDTGFSGLIASGSKMSVAESLGFSGLDPKKMNTGSFLMSGFPKQPKQPKKLSKKQRKKQRKKHPRLR